MRFKVARPPAYGRAEGRGASWLLAPIAWLFSQYALAQAAPGHTPAPDNLETRMLACAPCHGAHGQGTSDDYFPRLAGKPAGYLFNQLTAFRDGRRHYAPMNYLLEYQSDASLRAMAAYFAAQNPPFLPRHGGTNNSKVLGQGQALATGGDPARGIPACIACHNPGFTGMEPGIPALLGLQPNYISAQLGAWRYGTRTATAPDCMQIVAGRLTEADVTALAAWLSSLPARPDTKPLAQGALTPPLTLFFSAGTYQPDKSRSAQTCTNSCRTTHLSEQDMLDLAAYYSYLPRLPPYHPQAAGAAPKIVVSGAPMRNIPPCATCHGTVGYKLGTEWLEGESAVYLRTQLEAFTSGERHNDISEQMRNVARGMTHAEMEQAAEYYANQP